MEELIRLKRKKTGDENFNYSYPEYINDLSKTHWTPIDIAKIAIDWLVSNSESGVKVLDIGAGVGKFCLTGGLVSKALFTGVEKRKNLFNEANIILDKLSIDNVEFIHANITEIDFKNYNAFYYYNPFGEQIAVSDWIDKEVPFSEDKLNYYEEFVFNQLDEMPENTRVVTYYSEKFHLPKSYKIKNMMFDGELVLWEKINS